MARWQYQGLAEPLLPPAVTPAPPVSSWGQPTEQPVQARAGIAALFVACIAFVPLVVTTPTVSPLSWKPTFPERFASPARSTELLTGFAFTPLVASVVSTPPLSWQSFVPERFPALPRSVDLLAVSAFVPLVAAPVLPPMSWQGS